MTNKNTNIDLLHLLHETHDQMSLMMTWLEMLQPIEINPVDISDGWAYHNKMIVDLKHDDEKYSNPKYFRINDELVEEDQTSRSILKDLRKVIKHLEQQ